MGVTGSKGDLRGVKGSYLRHSDYDVIGRLLINQGGYLPVSLLMMSEGGSLGYAAYIVCLPVFEIYKCNDGIRGSKGELRGVKGS